MILAALLLAVLAPQTLPANTTPPSNTFITAAETVIDDAAAVNIHAPDDVYAAQMQQLKLAEENLHDMASTGDRDHEILTAVGDLVFAINTCHIQAKNGPTPDCDQRISTARLAAMQSIHKHKSNGQWQEGPQPSP